MCIRDRVYPRGAGWECSTVLRDAVKYTLWSGHAANPPGGHVLRDAVKYNHKVIVMPTPVSVIGTAW